MRLRRRSDPHSRARPQQAAVGVGVYLDVSREVGGLLDSGEAESRSAAHCAGCCSRIWPEGDADSGISEMISSGLSQGVYRLPGVAKTVESGKTESDTSEGQSQLITATEDPGGLLYHYTSAAGLVGIVNSRGGGDYSRQLTFYASDLLLMNDISELSFGLELVKAHAAEVAAAKDKSEQSENVQQLLDLCERYLSRPTLELLRASSRPCVCAASFTTKRDLLSQWVTYGAGGGFAIGLDLQTLQAAAYTARRTGGSDDRTFRCLLSRIAYGEDARSKIAELPFFDDDGARTLTALTGIQSIYRLFRAAVGMLKDPERQGLQPTSPEHAMAAIMIGLAAQCKDGAFDAENEWRLLAGGGDPASLADLIAGNYPPEFRAAGSRLLPYRPIVVSGQEGQSPIKKLVVGPAPDQAQLVHAVQQLLIANGHDPSVVRTSTAPYRGW